MNFLVEVEPGDVVLNPEEYDDFTRVDEGTVTNPHMTENMRKCMNDALSVIHS
ncbi:MAG TPA: hypothetical protein VK983_00970 [Candidatus Limnocylindrales bacterium]|nr:hypothetical protein [Candidatus Limnocylindrales bacterium]